MSTFCPIHDIFMALGNDPHVSREGEYLSRTTPSFGPDYFASCEHTICHSKMSF